MSEEQCLPCPVGKFSGAEGAAECDSCAAGSYVTLLARDTEGLGTSFGGEVCVACPAGRESTTEGSVLCSSCSAGTSSAEGEKAGGGSSGGYDYDYEYYRGYTYSG